MRRSPFLRRRTACSAAASHRFFVLRSTSYNIYKVSFPVGCPFLSIHLACHFPSVLPSADAGPEPGSMRRKKNGGLCGRSHGDSHRRPPNNLYNFNSTRPILSCPHTPKGHRNFLQFRRPSRCIFCLIYPQPVFRKCGSLNLPPLRKLQNADC